MNHIYIYEYYPYPIQAVDEKDPITVRTNDMVHKIQLEKRYLYCGLNPVIFGDSLETKKLNLIPSEQEDFGIEHIKLINVHFEDVDRTTRSAYYKKGFYLENDKTERVHFVRYKRSASSARTGSCLFIREELHSEMDAWSNCGLNPDSPLVKKNFVAFEAYKALTLSTCEDFFELDLNSILIVEDVKSEFEEDVYSVTDDVTVETEDCCLQYSIKGGKLSLLAPSVQKITNTIWDGEGLLDESVFCTVGEGKYAANGMMLLRNRYFKSCVFNTKLTAWFHYNGLYGAIDKTMINGYTRARNYEDIKMVITYSSLKYLKFFEKEQVKAGIEQWLANADCHFGIVKTDKKTNFFRGNCVRAGYQLINTLCLDRETIEELISPNVSLIHKIGADIDYYLYYLLNSKRTLSYDAFFLSETKGNEYYFGHGQPLMSESGNTPTHLALSEDFDLPNELFMTLVSFNHDFGQTSCFKKISERYVDALLNKLQAGKLLVTGTNATMFGNPYEFLKHIVKKFDINTYSDFCEGINPNEHIVMCTKFSDKTQLIGARSPHVMNGNVLCATNVVNPTILTWFNLTDEIVCVNSIGRNIQELLNGADFDSDFILLTDNKIINERTRSALENIYWGNKFLAPHNAIAEAHISEDSVDMAEVDNRLANNRVGQIINLAQRYNSIFWDIYYKEKCYITNDLQKCAPYYYNVCMLEVLSNVDLDSAKGKYDFNMASILPKMRNVCRQYNETKPLFMGSEKELGESKCSAYDTPMDYLLGLVAECQTKKPSYRPIEFYDLVDTNQFTFSRAELGGPDRDVVNAFLEEAAELGKKYGMIYGRQPTPGEDYWKQRRIKKWRLSQTRAEIEALYDKYRKKVICNVKRCRYAFSLMKQRNAFVGKNGYGYAQYLQLYLLTRNPHFCAFIFTSKPAKRKIIPCNATDYFLLNEVRIEDIDTNRT